MTAEEASSIVFSTDDQLIEEAPCLSPTNSHVFRSQPNPISRSHGPCTLVALCNAFYCTTLSEQHASGPKDNSIRSSSQDRSATDEAVKGILASMCLEAGLEESFDLSSDQIPIRLPPKQFLLMAQSQFFQQPDFATDIFVPSSFWSTVERIYSQPFNPADEAWAICFNTIILLVLGSEASNQGGDPLLASQFVLPFFSTVRTALSNPRILMAPRLINIQALTLLVSSSPLSQYASSAGMLTDPFLFVEKSIAARKYYPQGLTESIFAQACVLARTMGLHQTQAAAESFSPEEAQERFKVFRSLYLQDKSFLISRGSICWLPSFDCSLSSELGKAAPGDSNYAARIQLARLQEEIYQLFNSSESQTQDSATHRSALSRIEKGLEGWANVHDVFSAPSSRTRDIDLQLEFLATRISAFRGNSRPSRVRRALNDARASCLLLLIACGKHEQSLIQKPEIFPLSSSPIKPGSRISSPRPSKSKTPDRRSSRDKSNEDANDFVPSRFHTLLDTFSASAFFSLVSSVMPPTSADSESQTEEDISLLQKACACYKELDTRNQANNHTRKIGQAFEKLLEVVNLVRNTPGIYTSRDGMQQSSNTHTSPVTQNFFDGPQGLSHLPDLPTLSAYPIPPMSWDNFSPKNTSARATESASAGDSPMLLTPKDLEFFPPHFAQQAAPPLSKKRLRTSDLGDYMDDYGGSRLLSDYLTTSPLMSFGVAQHEDMMTPVAL
jgi:hypothetical protein